MLNKLLKTLDKWLCILVTLCVCEDYVNSFSETSETGEKEKPSSQCSEYHFYFCLFSIFICMFFSAYFLVMHV